ncbi:BnaC03g64790D [Brassica napus]|uniref:Sinigrinase n=1 Tax=Brassica napus TaxID=3708 RepID=A0A078GQG3_BRANA|nr:BnaC03g64790D [Brassica napus]
MLHCFTTIILSILRMNMEDGSTTESSKNFTAYADVCFREFGNHVKFWTTINEANIFTIGGYNDVVTPLGRCSSSPGRNCSSGNSSTEPYIVGHNLLLAHASASRLYMQKYKVYIIYIYALHNPLLNEMQGGCVGFSIFTIGFTPSTSYKDDEIAVQRAKDFFFGWMLGPLIFGDYPDEMKRTVGSRLPVFSLEESEQVKGSSDFIGIIHYLAASVTSINFKPSLSGHPDFYSDMGASMTCWNQKLISFKSQTNTLFLNLKYLCFFCVCANHLFLVVLLGRNRPWEFFGFRVCCCSMGYGSCLGVFKAELWESSCLHS